MANMETNIDGALTKTVFDLTQEIINACPERLAGTPACKKTAEMIAERMQPHCDCVGIEPFELHPGAFLGFMKFQAVSYLASTVLFLMGGAWRWFAAVGYTLANINSLSQFVFYKELFDRFYPKRSGYNVAATIAPVGIARQQVIVSGHHDAAYIFNYFTRFQKLYAIRITFGIIPTVAAMFLLWFWLVFERFTGGAPFYAPVLPYFLIIGIPFAGELFFFLGKRGVPGAGDNLIASAIVIKLAEIFGRAKKSSSPLLKQTRLILLSCDAEEAGLRGARAYVKRHRQELLAIPTYVLNLDSLYEIHELQFLTSDINGSIKLSTQMAKDCTQVAEELGYTAKLVPMNFGGGGTDAAEYAKIGVEATTLIAMSAKMIRDHLIYHTLEDKVENLDPKTIEAALKIAYRYILSKDDAFKGLDSTVLP